MSLVSKIARFPTGFPQVQWLLCGFRLSVSVLSRQTQNPLIVLSSSLERISDLTIS